MNYLFKALDDPTRREIIELLKKQDMTAGEIADNFDISKPSISYHLDLLKKAELVISVKKGKNVFYSLNTSVLEETVKWFYNLIKGSKNG
ncbi:MAG: autorepressor SdpR family transcription factor [Candidatus Kapaibacterium sp.]